MKPESMRFDNIDQIKNVKFVGIHCYDCKTFMAIDDFVKRPGIRLQDKAEALRQMSDRGMGCGRDEHLSDEDIVKGYMECA